MDNSLTISLIEQFAINGDMKCYDPYDVWKTKWGVHIKKHFYTRKLLYAAPAVLFTLADMLLNNSFRIGYDKQEYPVVRAFASLSLINAYNATGKRKYLDAAGIHINWLLNNSAPNLQGTAWGIGFPLPIASGLVYPSTTAFTTNTPYCLKAIHEYQKALNTNDYDVTLKNIYKFFMEDVKILFEDVNSIALSYSTYNDRIVTNAQSYSLFSIALLNSLFPNDYPIAKERIQKLYRFIVNTQRDDGSWLYEPHNPHSFIDCFHSCFIIKNVYEASKYYTLPNSKDVIQKGYTYIKSQFKDSDSGLYKRFTLQNKPSLIKDDLYDSAEMLGLSRLLGDIDEANSIAVSIKKIFHKGNDVYSHRDRFGLLRNKNTLRWAVMPYVYSLSSSAGHQ